MNPIVETLIDGERDYQDSLVNHGVGKVAESPTDFLALMQVYLNSAFKGTVGAKGSDEAVMAGIRKVTALGVAAMERNVTPPRA